MLLLSFLAACGNNKEQTQETKVAESSIDATRSFLQAALEGRFDQARTYLLADSINIGYMDNAERVYATLDSATKNNYRSASLRIHSFVPISDSLSIIIYSNSFKQDPDTLKIVRINNQWLVDLKYLYLHELDTTIRKDSVSFKPLSDTTR
jgi:hypothetical protein